MTGKPLSSATFWDLMARWDVPDDKALDLIGYAGGGPGRKRRFRLSVGQAQRLSAMLEIEVALTTSGLGASWLQTQSPRLRRQTPLQRIQAGHAREVMRALAVNALQAATAGERRGAAT
jgi:hypothetical protein